MLFTLGLAIITSLPYLAGHLLRFGGSQFSDILTFEGDQNNYLAYAHQAELGHWLFRNPMTPEPHNGVLFNSEWLLTGKLAALLGISVRAATHVVRLLSLLLLCTAIYWFAALSFRSTTLRRVALVAIMTGGGFGWLSGFHLVSFRPGVSPFLDLTTGLFPFFWSLNISHFLFPQAFAVLGLCLFLRGEVTGKRVWYVFAGIGYFLAGSSRPYDMLYLIAATGLYIAWNAWRESRFDVADVARAIPIFISAPLLLYYVWIFKFHPVLRWWSDPGAPPPRPWVLGFSFGFPVLLLLVSLGNFKAKPLSEADRLVICCLLSASLLVYTYPLLHFSFQFATDIAVPLLFVTLMGIEGVLSKRKTGNGGGGWLIVGSLLLVNSLTSWVLVTRAVGQVKQGEFRVEAGVLEGYAWLDRNSRSGAIVLADYANSNRLPQYTHNIAFCGYYNAVRYPEKQKDLDQFLSPGTPNPFREQLLRQIPAEFVLLRSSEDRRLPDLKGAPFVREVFRNEAIVIYAVI